MRSEAQRPEERRGCGIPVLGSRPRTGRSGTEESMGAGRSRGGAARVHAEGKRWQCLWGAGWPFLKVRRARAPATWRGGGARRGACVGERACGGGAATTGRFDWGVGVPHLSQMGGRYRRPRPAPGAGELQRRPVPASRQGQSQTRTGLPRRRALAPRESKGPRRQQRATSTAQQPPQLGASPACAQCRRNLFKELESKTGSCGPQGGKAHESPAPWGPDVASAQRAQAVPRTAAPCGAAPRRALS